jgi:hypothetical protein
MRRLNAGSAVVKRCGHPEISYVANVVVLSGRQITLAGSAANRKSFRPVEKTEIPQNMGDRGRPLIGDVEHIVLDKQTWVTGDHTFLDQRNALLEIAAIKRGTPYR